VLGSQQRVKSTDELLLRYLDGELSAPEAERFRARLAESPELRCRLRELQRVGALVRLWADAVGQRAGELVEPTLRRVQLAERRRAQRTTLGLGLAALLVAAALPWSGVGGHASPLVAPGPDRPAHGAAIERIEAGGKHAQVFVVGSDSTPIVWLADEAEGEHDGWDPG
jgi:anti-sigma factor RsiW